MKARRGPTVTVAAALFGLWLAGCTVGGSAVIAPYRSPPLVELSAAALRTTVSGVLAMAPNGSSVAVFDPVHGVCVRPLESGAGRICADLTLRGHPSMTAIFSPDGQRLAVGRDVSAQGRGSAWLVDIHTGTASQVPAVDASPVASTQTTPPRATSAGTPVAAGSTYTGMTWNAASGHLLLVSDSFGVAGPSSRIVDVDPGSLIPRVVAQATGPYEYQSGYLATGGSKVVFTVYRGDQIPPNPVIVDLATGARNEFGPVGPSGTQLVPLAVSPDGRQAIVGSATFGPAGPPHLLDLATGALTGIPGLTGDFVAAAYSPNGAQFAFFTHLGSAVAISVAPASGGPARLLRQVSSAMVAGSRLAWSDVDTLSISSPSVLPTGAVAGWALSTR